MPFSSSSLSASAVHGPLAPSVMIFALIFAAFLLEHFAKIAHVVVGKSPKNLPLFGLLQLGDCFIAGFTQDFSRFQTAARASNDLVAANVGIAAAWRENAEIPSVAR